MKVVLLNLMTERIDDDEEVKPQPGATLNEIIIGLYTRESLKSCFDHNPNE